MHSTKFITLGFCLLAFAPLAHSALLAHMAELENGEKQIELSNADGSAARYVTEGKLWHLYPSLSADGKSITYIEGPDADHLAVVTQDLNNGNTEQWSKLESVAFHPRISKNGKWIAYSAKMASGKNQIAVLDLETTRKEASRTTVINGSHTRTIYDSSPRWVSTVYASYFPAISSDGSFLIYQQDHSKSERVLVEVSMEDLSQTVLPLPSPNCMAPSLSFDDQKVAFTCKVSSNWDVYTYDRITKKVERMTTDPAQDFAPTFTPKGDLIFASDRQGQTFQLYLQEGHQEPTALTLGEGTHYAPSVSGDTHFKQSFFPEMLAPARSSFGAVKIGRRIYVVGGHQGVEHTYPESSFSARTEYFDLDSQKWIEVAPRPVAAQGFGVAAFGKYLYAFGGFAYNAGIDPHWRSLDQIDRFDTETGVWKTVGKLPRARSSNAVAQVGTNVYLMGGWNATPKSNGDLDGTFLSQIDAFDLVTETSSTLAVEIPGLKRRALSSVVVGDEVYLIGGLGQGATHFELLDLVTAFNTKTFTFRELPRLPYPTFAPAAGVLGDSVFLFGGMFKYSATDAGYVSHIYQMPLAGDSKWTHTGRYLKDGKSFAQVVELAAKTLGLLGGHSNYAANDAGNAPVLTFESFGTE